MTQSKSNGEKSALAKGFDKILPYIRRPKKVGYSLLDRPAVDWPQEWLKLVQ